MDTETFIHKINKYNKKLKTEQNKEKIAYYQSKINHYNTNIQNKIYEGGAITTKHTDEIIDKKNICEEIDERIDFLIADLKSQEPCNNEILKKQIQKKIDSVMKTINNKLLDIKKAIPNYQPTDCDVDVNVIADEIKEYIKIPCTPDIIVRATLED